MLPPQSNDFAEPKQENVILIWKLKPTHSYQIHLLFSIHKLRHMFSIDIASATHIKLTKIYDVYIV